MRWKNSKGPKVHVSLLQQWCSESTVASCNHSCNLEKNLQLSPVCFFIITPKLSLPLSWLMELHHHLKSQSWKPLSPAPVAQLLLASYSNSVPFLYKFCTDSQTATDAVRLDSIQRAQSRQPSKAEQVRRRISHSRVPQKGQQIPAFFHQYEIFPLPEILRNPEIPPDKAV